MAVYNLSGNIIGIDSSSTVFVNVKDFEATGDGITDDASAIQSALDFVKTQGGIIYFPVGTYLIKSAILFYSHQTLLFENGSKILQGASINNLMRTYCNSSFTGYDGVHDCLIYGGIFDGGNFETNNTLVGTCHAKNITFENCKFLNAYGTYHNLEINSSYNVKIINCEFEGSRKTDENGELVQIDGAGAASYYPWDSANMDNTVSKYIDVKGCLFRNSPIATGVGNHSNMYHKFIRIHDCVFDGFTTGRAIGFMPYTTNIDIHDNTFSECEYGIKTGGSSIYAYDNRFVDVTTAIEGTYVTSHANMINGTYTA